jgi:hypothetical protein
MSRCSSRLCSAVSSNGSLGLAILGEWHRLAVFVKSFLRHYTSDAIVIPDEARGHVLSSFPMSVRLANVLDSRKIRLLGELNGLTYGQIRNYRNCGRKTLDELRALVGMICAGKLITPTDIIGIPSSSPAQVGCTFLPEEANKINVSDLPLPRPSKETLAEFMAKVPPVLCRALAVVHSVPGVTSCGSPTRLKTMDELVRDCGGLSRRTIERLVWKPTWDNVNVGVASKFIEGCGVDIFHQSFSHYFIEKCWDRDLPHLSESHRQRLKKVLGLE